MAIEADAIFTTRGQDYQKPAAHSENGTSIGMEMVTSPAAECKDLHGVAPPVREFASDVPAVFATPALSFRN